MADFTGFDATTGEHVSRLRVRYAETDQMGVVYHANYLVWCEIGRTDFIRALGRSYASLEADGVRLAVADASLRFHAPARYDDAIVVRTRILDVRSRAMRFAYAISRDADPAASPPVASQRLVTAETTLVALDGDGRTASLPADVREWLAAAVRPA